MDVFKKFRSRRKNSKGQADSVVSFTDAELEHRSPSSTWHESVNTTPKRTRPNNVSNGAESIHLSQTTSPTASLQPGANGRVQPLFTGVSRPGTSNTQHASGGSADKMSPALSRNIASPLSQMSTKTSRHVDILALAGPSNKPSTTYNEDVAERNLAVLTRTEEEKRHLYNPSSKYQEEVATRNAHQISVERAFSVRSGGSTNMASGFHNGGLGLSGSYLPYNLGSSISRLGHVHESSTTPSRPHGIRAKEDKHYLLSRPNDENNEEALRDRRARVEEAEREMEAARQRWLEAKRMDAHEQPPDREKYKHTHQNATRGQQTAPSHFNRSDIAALPEYEKGIAGTDMPSDGSLQQYRQGSRETESQLELSDRLNPLIKINSQQRFSDGSRRYHSSRTSSNLSTASGTRRAVVGNRMIMDLTEDEADSQSVLSYRETPVLQQATSGAFQKVRPEVIETHSPSYEVSSDEVVPNKRWSSALEPVLSMDQLARRSQIQPLQALPENRPPIPSPQLSHTIRAATPPVNSFGFSAISTITSTSPRASNAALPAQTEVTEPQIEKRRAVYSPTPTIAPVSRTQDAATVKSAPRTIAAITSRVSIIADVAPEDAEHTDSPVSDVTVTAHTILAKAQERLQQENLGLRREVAERGISRQSAVEAVRKASQDKLKTTSVPEQEVKTRDFALVPTHKPSTEKSRSSKSAKRPEKKQTEAQKTIADIINPPTAPKSTKSKSAKSSSTSEKSSTKSSSRGKRPAKQNSSATRKTRPMSIFDEEAFKRKQADANAALLKLQMSLNEALPPVESGTPPPRPIFARTTTMSPTSQMTTTTTTTTTTSTEKPAISVSPARSMSLKARPQPITTETLSTVDEVAERRLPTITSSNPFMSHSRTNTLKSTVVPLNAYLARVDGNEKPPRSPGEISLSAFPIPTPRAMSPEATKPTYTHHPVSPSEPARRNSQASRMSSASTYSIPFSMVPGRNSSLQSQQGHQTVVKPAP